MVKTADFEIWLAAFQSALNAHDIPSVTALFARRMLLARSGVLHMERRHHGGPGRHCGDAAIAMDAALPVTIAAEGDAIVANGGLEGWFDFETATSRGKGYVRLRDGGCWTLLTSISELKRFEEPSGYRRDVGIVHEAKKGRVTWLEERQREEATLGIEVQPYCLIVGGGQCGLALGARLKRLGVPTLIVDALSTPGDAWRRRYKSLYLHDAVWADHMPYLPFPDHWPVYMSKDKMGDWLEIYAKAMELNVWGSDAMRMARATIRSLQRWTVTVKRAGQAITLQPTQLILATGLSGLPQTPTFAGADRFEGVQYHSSDHQDGAALAGKACVVIGANQFGARHLRRSVDGRCRRSP